MRRQLSAGVIGGISLATASFSLIHLVTILAGETFPLISFITEVLLPLLFSGLVVAVGYWVFIDDRPDQAMVRLALWCVAGSAVIGGFEFLTFYSQLLGGAELTEELQTLNAAVARGAVLGVALGLFDIERQRTKRREAELERQVDRLEEFASVVSHDLRSPLTVAQGHVELIRDEIAEENLKQLEFAHTRMTEIIEDSLALARGGNEVTEVETVSLGEMAERAWKTVASDEDTLEIEHDLTFEADPERLQRILENLFRNSIEHASSDSRPHSETEIELGFGPQSADTDEIDPVTVVVGRLADEDGFFVADSGPGIDPDEREAVFEAGNSGTEMGSGLGLAIVRRIAQAHGWEVSIADSETGGARFEFDIDP